MYNEELEKLIELALNDGILTQKEEKILLRKAEELGIDKDEFEMVLESRIYEKSGPKEIKDDHIRKCPACKAVVKSFLAECPECGTEFRNFGSSKTLLDLFSRLENVPMEVKKLDFRYKTSSTDKDGSSREEGIDIIKMNNAIIERQASIVENFPIPYTTQDVLEFLHFTLPKMLAKGTDKRLKNAWRNRFEEVLERAKVVFRNDPVMINELNSVMNRVNNINYSRRKKRNKILYAIGSILLVSLMIVSLIFKTPLLRMIYEDSNGGLNTHISSAISERNFQKAKRLSSYYKYSSDRESSSADIYKMEILSNIENKNITNAENLFITYWESLLKRYSNVEDYTRPIFSFYVDQNEQTAASALIKKIQVLGIPTEAEILQGKSNEKWPK